ncbi:MAG: FGGY family carbohydrate kinase, partial [Bacillota bacterium]
MSDQYILAIDQGTTSSRAIIYNHNSEIIGKDQKEFTQLYPKPGWVEHNPKVIWSTTLDVIDGS